MANQYTVKKKSEKTGKEKFLEARKLVDGGMKIKDAANQVGIAHGMYSYYSAQEKRSTLPKVVAIPEAPSQMIMIVGSPSQIAEAARKFL